MSKRQPIRWIPGVNRFHPQARGVVLSLPCWEGGGDKIRDYSGDGNHGAITGATWTTWAQGRGLTFNGTSDYVACGTGVGDFGTDDFSILAWVKPTGDGNNRTIAGKGQTSADDWLFYNNAATSGQLRFYADAGVVSLTPTEPWDFTDWQLVAVTRRGATARLYRQTAPNIPPSVRATDTSASADIGGNAHGLTIGASEDGTARFWDDGISNVLILQGVGLTTGQIGSYFHDPWRLYRQPSRLPLWAAATGGAAAFGGTNQIIGGGLIGV